MNDNQSGASRVWIIPVVLLSLAVIGLAAFSYWAYAQYQDHKNNTDQKVATAVADARVQQQQELAEEFAQREKEPFRKFTSPEQFGSISFNYPKTWSVYVDEAGQGSRPFDAYFHPQIVQPTDSDTPEALRLEVTNRNYNDILQQFDSRIENGELRASAIKLRSGNGTRIDGRFDDNIEGSMVVFPLRDKTVQVYTESNTFLGDFNDIILPSLAFIP